MCDIFPPIKIAEGNAFGVLIPLKKRTYVANKPLDEDIDATELQNVVLKFGGEDYTPILSVEGVKFQATATLALGGYSIELTATYKDYEIRAAYESAIVIVPWSQQSNALQYIQGSPVVVGAAYVIASALTDAELEELKRELREEKEHLTEAIAEAERAKAAWEEKAAALDGVAQEQTSQEILYTVRGVAQQGENPEATNTAIYELVEQEGIPRANKYAADIREIIGDWESES